MINPRVVPFQGRFAIVFTRDNKKLTWVQDASGKKMKYELIALPVVSFLTRAAAEQELRETVIPYLLKEKDVGPEEIVGW